MGIDESILDWKVNALLVAKSEQNKIATMLWSDITITVICICSYIS